MSKNEVPVDAGREDLLALQVAGASVAGLKATSDDQAWLELAAFGRKERGSMPARSASERLRALLLIYENSKKRQEGQVFALFFLLYAPLRFFLETTRGDIALLGLEEGALSPAQRSSITLFVIALIGFVLISRRNDESAQGNA